MKIICFSIKSERKRLDAFLNHGIRVIDVRLRDCFCYIGYEEIDKNIITSKYTFYETQKSSRMSTVSGSNPLMDILNNELASNIQWDVFIDLERNTMKYIVFFEYKKLPLTDLTVDFVKKIVPDLIEIFIDANVVTLTTESHLSYNEQHCILDIFNLERFYSKDRKEKTPEGNFLSYFK